MEKALNENNILEKLIKLPQENRIIQLGDIIQHKKYILDVANKMCNFFIKENEDEIALQLLKRIFEHDISKLSLIEFYGYSLNSNNWDKKDKPKETEDAINHHYNVNKHHPEYWDKNMDDMSDFDILEMFCDWQARSLQFNNDLWDYYDNKLRLKFKFPQNVEEQIRFYYCIYMQQ